MKYIALLRGINVGGNKILDMKKIKKYFEKQGYTNVTTYINSGNIIFESTSSKTAVTKSIISSIKEELGWDIPTLVKTSKEIQEIAKAIPRSWQNDTEYKTDVAYLFAEADSPKVLIDLPINKEYLDIRYVKGALLWHIARKNYNKSKINKLIGHKIYQLMTVRNVNTARTLAERYCT